MFVSVVSFANVSVVSAKGSINYKYVTRNIYIYIL